MKRHPKKMLGGCLPRSLSEERFQEVNALIFEAIVCGDNANGDVAESIIGRQMQNQSLMVPWMSLTKAPVLPWCQGLQNA